MPATTERWAKCEPNFRSFDGWPEVDWADAAEEGYDALPENAKLSNTSKSNSDTRTTLSALVSVAASIVREQL